MNNNLQEQLQEQLPEQLQEFGEARRAGFLRVKELKESGMQQVLPQSVFAV